jgi:hypothetical protein
LALAGPFWMRYGRRGARLPRPLEGLGDDRRTALKCSEDLHGCNVFRGGPRLTKTAIQPREMRMKTALKIGALLFALSAGGALAQEKKPTTTPPTTMTGQQAMTYAKKMDAQERQSMMEQAKQIDAQIAQLQTQVKSLMQRLSQQPKYFDNPTEDKLRP